MNGSPSRLGRSTRERGRRRWWTVEGEIGPLNAGGPFTMTIAGKNTMTLHDVLVGEVWVCSGQSNMEMPVGTNSRGLELGRSECPG